MRSRRLNFLRGAAALLAVSCAVRAAAQLPGDDAAVHPDDFHCPPDPPGQPDFAEALAWLEFPRLGLLAPVYEGTRGADLDRGAGLVEGTALPGVPDRRRNCVIAAHRTSFFSPLESAVPGDVLTLITGAGAVEFVVDRILVVTPDHVELEAPTRSSRLTLVTCTPFNYLGSAPRRLVVIASRRASREAHRPRARSRHPRAKPNEKRTPGRASFPIPRTAPGQR